MPGFASYDDLITEITTNGKNGTQYFTKVGGAATAAGVWQSLARVVGTPAAIADGAIGSGTPGSGGTALTGAAGNIVYPNVSTDLRFLLTFGGISTVACSLRLYDRLVHVSGLATGTTGTKNVGSAALPRYTAAAAVGNEVWLEYTTASTAAGAVNLLTYTDEGGATGNVGGSVIPPAAAMVINSMVGPLPLASGDLGVRSVETINVGTAMTTSVTQLVIMRPIATIYLPANTWVEQDYVMQLTALPRIFDGASLNLMYLATATTAANVWGVVRTGYG